MNPPWLLIQLISAKEIFNQSGLIRQIGSSNNTSKYK